MKPYKKIIFLLVCLLPTLLLAQKPHKETYAYAIRDNKELLLDIYTIDDTVVDYKQKPCLLFVFGGGFKAGTRDAKHYQDYFDYFAKKGFTVVSIDYRLGIKGEKAPSLLNYKPLEKSISLAVEDLYDATNYLLNNAKALNIDTKKFIISGSSAGAITVLQADYEKRNNFHSASIPPSNFHYSGVISLAGGIFSHEGIPYYNIPPAPTLFFHGSADKLVPYNNQRFFRIGIFGSNTLAREFRKREYPYLFYSMEGEGHNVSEYPMVDFLPEIEQFITDYVLNRKRLLIDINYNDRDREPQKSETPAQHYK